MSWAGCRAGEAAIDRTAVLAAIQEGCTLGFQPACDNTVALNSGGLPHATGPPPAEDLPILLRGSKGPITDRTARSLYLRACAQGWPDSCDIGER